MNDMLPTGCRTIRVTTTWGASINSYSLHVLGIAANIVLLLCASVVLIYTHQQVSSLPHLGIDVGTHKVSTMAVGLWIIASIGCHAFLGLSALIAYRSRYCLNFTAVALSIVCWIIWLLAYCLGLAALLYSSDKSFLLQQGLILGGGVVWAALNLSGAVVFATVRRKSLKPVSRVVENHPGQYFVYLRSFVADAETSPDRSPLWYFTSLGTFWIPILLNPFYFVSFRRQNPEEIILLNGMARIYPVVAIGEPGEVVPPLGASRLYVDHDRWQAVATTLADNSCAVLILPHSTAGVVWEFTELCLRTHPSRAVIILPQALASLQWSRHMRVTHHADLWREFLAALASHPIVSRLPTTLPYGALSITFADDWSPLIWLGTPHTANFRQIARYVALNATSPTSTN